MKSTAHIQVAGVPLRVEYDAITDRYAVIDSVTPDNGLDDIKRLLAPDVINSIRVACVKHAREEAAFLRRCEEQEAIEP